MNKAHSIETALREIRKKRIAVLELGRIRNSKPHYSGRDGWSTLRFVEAECVKRLVSVDIDPKTRDVCMEFPQIANSEKIVFLDSVAEIGPEVFDLIFLDTDNDPNEIFDLYVSLLGQTDGMTCVLIDDVYSQKGCKGDRLVPLLEEKGFTIVQFGVMAFARPW